MKIYVFHNKVRNELSGNFYFIASDRQDANQMALSHQKNYNRKSTIATNRNYTIEFDFEDVDDYPIVPGYLPLNRAT